MSVRGKAQGKKPTLKDVGELASVSPYTVSVVLNGAKSNTRVSEATRERIQAAALELGYQANRLARALGQQSTNIIGLYFGYGQLEPHDPFHAEVLTGLQRGCQARDKDLMIHYSFHRFGVDEIFAELAGGTIDGLVMLAAPNDPLVAKLKGSRLPVVAMTDRIPGIPSILADDENGSRAIAEHLHARGHRTVLYRLCPGPSDSAERRHRAFAERAQELGMKIIEGRTADWKGRLSVMEEAIVAARHENGATAVVCWGDPSAHSFLAYLKSKGLRAPRDFAVAGFNGIEAPVEVAQELTTVRAYWSKVAEGAVHLLANCLEGNEEVPDLTVLPVELSLGDTS